MSDDIRIPAFDVDTAPFWTFAHAGELRMQQCVECMQVRWPPGPQCPKCWSTRSEWILLSGMGRLQGWVVYRRRYLEGFEPPYVVASVRLDEGPGYQSNLHVPNGTTLVKGLRVEVYFEKVDESTTLPQFRLSGESP